MLSFNANQLAMVAKASKIPSWRFYIYDKNGVAYASPASSGFTTVVLMDFAAIELRRNSSENNTITPSDTSFSISNPNNSLLFTDFKGGNVLIELWSANSDGTGDLKLAGWRFRIKTAEPGYQKMKIQAEDFLQYYLRGYYPNTRYPQDIFPSNRTYDNDALCVPVPFGTAYVPLRDVYIPSAVMATGHTISAIASTGGLNCKFVDSAAGFSSIESGRTITVTGFTSATNNSTFAVVSATASTIEMLPTAGIVTESAGNAISVTHGSGYMMLGDPTKTYTLTKLRSPRDWGAKSEYLSSTYSFNQYTLDDADSVSWKVFQAIIADVNNDTICESPGFWMTSGGACLDTPVKFTRNDTAAMTSPADVIEFVLKDMGAPATFIDTAVTFAAAKIIYANWSLTFNGAFWYKEERVKILSKLLTMCNSYLVVGEKIELHVRSKTSVKTITSADVLRTSDKGPGTFVYKDIVNTDYSDCGYVAWQKTDEAQDQFIKSLTAANGLTATVVSKDILECSFVQNSIDVRRIGILHFQRKLLKEAECNFKTKLTCLAIQPDDVLQINEANYGGTYDVLVDSIKINKNFTIDIGCSKYTSDFNDWTDLNPAEITIPNDDTANSWQPTISGPSSDVDNDPNTLPGAIRIGDGSIILDPSGPAIRVGAATNFMSGSGIWIGRQLNDYKFRTGDPTSRYIKWDGDNLAIIGRNISGDSLFEFSTSSTATNYVQGYADHKAIELELMKMSFQSISWAQFAIFESFDDDTKRADPDPSANDAVVSKSQLTNGNDDTSGKIFGFVSKNYSNITTLFSGTANAAGENYLQDELKVWFVNECKNLTLCDSTAATFNVISNDTDTLVIAGTAATGSYSLKTVNPQYCVAFCSYSDAGNGGYGYVKFEVSFNGGVNYQTFLDTKNSINYLEATVAIANPGVDYIVRLSLENDVDGMGATIYKFLVCTDPSMWRF